MNKLARLSHTATTVGLPSITYTELRHHLLLQHLSQLFFLAPVLQQTNLK